MLEILDKMIPVVIASVLFALVAFLKKHKEKKPLAFLLTVMLTGYWGMILLIAHIACLTALDLQGRGENALGMYLVAFYLFLCTVFKIYQTVSSLKNRNKPTEQTE
ncbi:MAG: hypothetical protein R3Y63_08190 [Eubacteriales bacterium]